MNLICFSLSYDKVARLEDNYEKFYLLNVEARYDLNLK